MLAALGTQATGDHDATTTTATLKRSTRATSSSITLQMPTTSTLWGDVHIPLPIILYSEEHGLDVFMSSAFEGHGDVELAERPSGATYALSHGHIALAHATTTQ